jgi:hypothetical protein
MQVSRFASARLGTVSGILAAFQAAGVEFTGMEEAMTDPLNQKDAPLITPCFLNHIQNGRCTKG